MGKNVISTHWYLGSALGAPQKKLLCLFLEHLQRCAVTVATALGPDILICFIQSRARWSQVPEFGAGCASIPLDLLASGLLVWGRPHKHPVGRAAVACSFALAFLRTG